MEGDEGDSAGQLPEDKGEAHAGGEDAVTAEGDSLSTKTRGIGCALLHRSRAMNASADTPGGASQSSSYEE